jgi:hypothetical protein
MSQGASSGDSKKRFQNPAYVYGPMVYQFPPEHEAEKEKSKSGNQGINFLVLALIIVLVVGGVILYLKESGVDIRQLGLGRAILGQQTYRRVYESPPQAPPQGVQARVAVDSLYLREGPGADYVATYLLPEDWAVSLLGDYQTDNSGETWARVLVETDEGAQEGWVSRRYLD